MFKDLENNILDNELMSKFKSVQLIQNRPFKRRFNQLLIGFLIGSMLFVFLPWTQNIKGSGFVTTLAPEQRPQTIHSTIAGCIEKWYVKEGQFVNKGDTILFITEIKEDYLDPNLVSNIQNQINAKKLSQESYNSKVGALTNQINSITEEQKLKVIQVKNKVQQSYLKVKSDSMDLEATKTQLKIATTQYNRSVALTNEGLKPISDLEDKRLKQQEVEAKLITYQNKLLASRNELINSKIEINRITAEYSEKSFKAKSDQFTALSNQFDTEAQVNKLQNQHDNYKIRNSFYYIKAPQSGYINRALKSGLGETIKEGTPIASIMPSKYDIAVETYINPIDFPLIHVGEKVRLWFDGWPTIVFSGWPNISYGTFGGEIVAIENFISDNGKYRILIAQDPKEQKWPKQLSIGAGAKTFALLDNVPIWYELWRQLNGFPPDFYNPTEKKLIK